MTKQVFLSYSTDDTAMATQVRDSLEAQGIPCWMAPRDIVPGEDYAEQIIRAIEACPVLLLVLSESSNRSQYVRNEVERAVAKRKVVIPFRIHNVQPSRSLEFFISNAQWIDAWTPPLATKVELLIAAIQNHLHLPGESVAETAHRAEQGAVKVATPPRHNLPAQTTPFVGRAEERDELTRLLTEPATRLVTIIGPGGMGKTRLAMQVALDLLEHFIDGVYFVPLASLSDPGLVVASLAHPLGVQETGAQPLLTSVQQYLQDKVVLLVLDNFEHLLAAAPLVATLLAECSRLKVLVTSRTVLHLYGEHEFPLPPLTLPDPKLLSMDSDLVSNLMQYTAVSLFVQRAAALMPGFALTTTNAATIAEICIALDGMPLAIELAAARIKLFPPPALLARLVGANAPRLHLLTGGARDLPVRQQTLRNTIAWSYNSLEEEERILLRRLSVFVGGFTLEAGEAVCAASDASLVTLSIAVLEGIGSLVDNSLLWRAAQVDGELRFGMLETIREYALEQLAASGEAAAIQQRHAEFCLAFAEDCSRHIFGPEQEVWLNRLEAEFDNMLSALIWSKVDPSRIGLGLRLAVNLYFIWNRRGRISEGRAWLTEMLARPEATSYPLWRADALKTAGKLATRQGDYMTATALLEESVAASRVLGDKDKLAKSLWSLADMRRLQNNPEGASAPLEESLALVRERGNNFEIGLSLYSLGDIALLRSDVAQATALYKEGLVLHRQIANKRGIAHGLNGLGRAAQQVGDYEQARALYEESLAISHDLKNKSMIAWLWIELGNVALQQDEYEQALTLYKQGLVVANELELKRNIAEGLVGIAGVLGLTGQPEQAVQLFSQAERVLNMSGARLDPPSRAINDDNIAAMRARLSEADFARAWDVGGAFALEQAIAIALSPPELS